VRAKTDDKNIKKRSRKQIGKNEIKKFKKMQNTGKRKTKRGKENREEL
jgi:hypothetical protein